MSGMLPGSDLAILVIPPPESTSGAGTKTSKRENGTRGGRDGAR